MNNSKIFWTFLFTILFLMFFGLFLKNIDERIDSLEDFRTIGGRYTEGDGDTDRINSLKRDDVLQEQIDKLKSCCEEQ